GDRPGTRRELDPRFDASGRSVRSDLRDPWRVPDPGTDRASARTGPRGSVHHSDDPARRPRPRRMAAAAADLGVQRPPRRRRRDRARRVLRPPRRFCRRRRRRGDPEARTARTRRNRKTGGGGAPELNARRPVEARTAPSVRIRGSAGGRDGPSQRHAQDRDDPALGDAKNPLLVSVRSGAAMSMPGMMDTVLNLGLNDDTRKGLAALTKNERFAADAYRRFISMFGRIVLDIAAEKFDHALEAKKKAAAVTSDPDLGATQLDDLVREFKSIVQRETGKPFPTDPQTQLRLAIEAVFGSWFGKRAVDYRNTFKISNELGTACSVVTMVFGNMGEDSGTGVAFTRDRNTGQKVLYGEYLTNA